MRVAGYVEAQGGDQVRDTVHHGMAQETGNEGSRPTEQPSEEQAVHEARRELPRIDVERSEDKRREQQGPPG